MDRQEKINLIMSKYHDWNIIHDDWWDGVYGIWEEKLEVEGFEDPKIYFSGFWSQGDGACFTSSIDVQAFLKTHKEEIIQQHIHDIFELRELINETGKYECIGICAHIDHNGRHCHEHTMDVVYCIDDIEEEEGIPQSVHDFLCDELPTWLEERAKDMAREIYRELENEYEYLTSEEAVIESLQINDIIDKDLNFFTTQAA